jgi:hypothetical protein
MKISSFEPAAAAQNAALFGPHDRDSGRDPEPRCVFPPQSLPDTLPAQPIEAPRAKACAVDKSTHPEYRTAGRYRRQWPQKRKHKAQIVRHFGQFRRHQGNPRPAVKQPRLYYRSGNQARSRFRLVFALQALLQRSIEESAARSSANIARYLHGSDARRLLAIYRQIRIPIYSSEILKLYPGLF